MYLIFTTGRLSGTELVRYNAGTFTKVALSTTMIRLGPTIYVWKRFLEFLMFRINLFNFSKKIFDNGKYNCNLFGICAVVIFALSARDMWIVVLTLIMLLKLHHQSNSGIFTWSFGWFCEKDKQIIYLSDALARLFAFRLAIISK